MSSVFLETLNMLSFSFLLYAYADLRELARYQQLNISLTTLNPPLSMKCMVNLIRRFRHLLRSDSTFPFEFLNNGVRNKKKRAKEMLIEYFDWNHLNETLVAIHDFNAHDDLVYGITINKKRKRITVIFRGSVTLKDFLMDLKISQIKVKNPLYTVDCSSPKTISLHSGFYEYLLVKHVNATKSHLENIFQILHSLHGHYHNYELYSTGHSLGGALSTLFGFYTSSSPIMYPFYKNHPLCIISIASPYVGNKEFAISFQQLEKCKKIQHLRVVHERDVVTYMPLMAPRLNQLNVSLKYFVTKKKNHDNYQSLRRAFSLYKHVGIKLCITSQLKSKKKIIYYPKSYELDEQILQELCSLFRNNDLLKNLSMLFGNKQVNLIRFHSCEEYLASLKTCQFYLHQDTIHDLYNNRNIIGSLLDSEHRQKSMIATKGCMRILNSNIAKYIIGWYIPIRK